MSARMWEACCIPATIALARLRAIAAAVKRGLAAACGEDYLCGSTVADDVAPPSEDPMRYRSDHIHLRSRDAVAAAGFYVETFGAREVRRVGEGTVERVVIDLGGFTVFIEQAPEDTHPAARTPCLGIEHIGFTVDDIEAAMADLTRRGVPVRTGITERGPGLRIAFVEGPDGALIEILERKTV